MRSKLGCGGADKWTIQPSEAFPQTWWGAGSGGSWRLPIRLCTCVCCVYRCMQAWPAQMGSRRIGSQHVVSQWAVHGNCACYCCCSCRQHLLQWWQLLPRSRDTVALQARSFLQAREQQSNTLSSTHRLPTGHRNTHRQRAGLCAGWLPVSAAGHHVARQPGVQQADAAAEQQRACANHVAQNGSTGAGWGRMSSVLFASLQLGTYSCQSLSVTDSGPLSMNCFIHLSNLIP